MKRISLLFGLLFSLFILISCNEIPTSEYTVGEIVGSIQVGYAVGDNQEHVTKDISLPLGTSLNSDIKISWTSANTSVISNLGEVVRTDVDTLVDLEYNVVYLDLSFSSIMTFKVIEEEQETIPTYEVRYYFQNVLDDEYTLEETVTFESIEGRTVFIIPVNEVGFTRNTELSVTDGVVLKDEVISLDVYYDRKLYDVDLYDGSVLMDTIQVKYGSVVTVVDPVKEGFQFLDWILYGTSNVYDFSSPVLDDLKLEATFKFENEDYIYTGYYQGAGGLFSDDLVTFLNTISNRTFTGVTYGEVRYILDETDADPSNPSNVVLVYLGTSISGVWDYGNTWNREHVWPQSKMPASADNDQKNMASDLHNLKPSDPAENARRSNDFFSYSEDGSVYEPRDEVKGDIARILFYMDIMYDELSLIVSNVGEKNVYTMGNLETLLEWHEADPVDDFEMNRNNIIEDYQGNRNPFIDHPEFVDKVYTN